MSANPNTSSMAESFLEWWHIAVFAVTTIIGYALGTAKRGWTIDQLQSKLTALEGRIDALTKSTDADSRTVGLLGNDLSHIRSTLVEIKQKLEALT